MPTSVSALATIENPTSSRIAKVRDASDSPRTSSSVFMFSTATVGSTARSSRWTLDMIARGSADVRMTRSFENAEFCQSDRYTSGSGAFARSPVRPFATTPMISVDGRSRPPCQIRFPTAPP